MGASHKGFVGAQAVALSVAVLLTAPIGPVGRSLAAETASPPTAEQDHQLMMDRLGIQALRPGPSGNETVLNHANYDEAKANPYPDWPDPMVLDNGGHTDAPNVKYFIAWADRWMERGQAGR